MIAHTSREDLVLHETAPDSYRGQAQVAGRQVDVEAKFVKQVSANETAFAEASMRLDLHLPPNLHGREELLSAMRAVEATLVGTSGSLPVVLDCAEEPAGEGAGPASSALALTLWSCEAPRHENDEPRALASALHDVLCAARTLAPVLDALDTRCATPGEVRRACAVIDEIGLQATADDIARTVRILAIGAQHAG